MREILFRGKRIDNGEWVFGDLLRAKSYIDDIERYYIFTDAKAFPANEFIGDEEIIRKTVGQFTGLPDKNGKRIFEGDIVKFTDSPFGYSYTGSVCFYKGSFCIQYTYWGKDCFHRIGKTEEWRDMGASGTITFEYEIIGNIHDNPELLINEHPAIL